MNQSQVKCDDPDTCTTQSQARWSALQVAYRALGLAASRGQLTYSKVCVEDVK